MLWLHELDETTLLSIQIGAVLLWLGLVFLVSEVMHRLRWNGELVRKVVHIGTGNVLLVAWALQIPLWLCLTAGIVFSGVAYLSYFSNILPMLNGVGRKTHGVFYYAVSITLLVACFWQNLPQYAVVGVMVMSWGDGIAALVGQRWGKYAYSCMGNKRTLEGSLSMLAIAYVMTLSILAIACHCFDPSHLTIALPVALAATLCEAISPGGTDNLTVPIGSALLCYGLDLLM